MALQEFVQMAAVVGCFFHKAQWPVRVWFLSRWLAWEQRTVEPLIKDHPHDRLPLSWDHCIRNSLVHSSRHESPPQQRPLCIQLFFFLNNGRLSGVPLYLISGNLCCVWLALSACITRSSLLLQSGVTCDGVAKKEKRKRYFIVC